MEWATKMYSPNRYLKDVLAVRDDIIPIESAAPDEIRALRQCFVDYWYFAEIGFDFDDIFVQRVNAVWKQVKSKYISLINATSNQLNGYKLTKSGGETTTIMRGTSDTTTTTDSGSDTFYRKQDDKAYQRASQNSSVESTLNNTTTYGKKREDVTVKSGSDSTYLRTDRTDSNEYYDTEKLISYMKETSIYKSFVLEFSKCFMEVL